MTPPAALLAALGKIPGSLYMDHVQRFGEDRECGCEANSCDDDCNVGVALFRLRIREMAGAMVRA